MAQRGVFFAKEAYPYFEEVYVSFPWFGGHSAAQKRRCALSLELNLKAAYPDAGLCEISSLSPEPIGAELSAMSVRKRLSDGRLVPVESAFQSSRIYRDRASGEVIGPFPELIGLDGRECKKRVKELSRGLHSYEYSFDGMSFPAPGFHISLFYDYVYLTALTEPQNAGLASRLLVSGFDVFSDLATKSLNSQARSCAIYIGLARSGELGRLSSYDSYMELIRVDPSGRSFAADGAYDGVQLLRPSGEVRLLRPAVPESVGKEQVLREFDAGN